VPVRELAEQCRIPVHFLGKICHRLTRGGILASYKGPNGGVALARPAEEIRLLQVVEAMDGLDGFGRCVLGLDACDDTLPCPLHATWCVIKLRMLDMLSGATLSDLALQLADGKAILRLTGRETVPTASGGGAGP
jgi:Rrf2 family protein